MVDSRSCFNKTIDPISYYLSFLDKPIICGRSSNQIMAALFHLLDLLSDYVYLITVPIYSPTIFWLFIISIILPLILQILLTLVDPKLREKGVGAQIRFLILAYIGLFDLFEFNLEVGNTDVSEESANTRSYLQLMFAIFEDIPQFSLQMINSVLIG